MSQMNWKMQTDGRRQNKASASSFPYDHWIQAITLAYFILNLKSNLVLLKSREQRTGAWGKERTSSYWSAPSFHPALQHHVLCSDTSSTISFFSCWWIAGDWVEAVFHLWFESSTGHQLLFFGRLSSAAFNCQNWCKKTEDILLLHITASRFLSQ